MQKNTEDKLYEGAYWGYQIACKIQADYSSFLLFGLGS